MNNLTSSDILKNINPHEQHVLYLEVVSISNLELRDTTHGKSNFLCLLLRGDDSFPLITTTVWGAEALRASVCLRTGQKIEVDTITCPVFNSSSFIDTQVNFEINLNFGHTKALKIFS